MIGETITCNKISLQFYDQSSKKNGFFSIVDKDSKKVVGTLALFDQNNNLKSAQLRNKGIIFGLLHLMWGLFVYFVVEHFLSQREIF